MNRLFAHAGSAKPFATAGPTPFISLANRENMNLLGTTVTPQDG